MPSSWVLSHLVAVAGELIDRARRHSPSAPYEGWGIPDRRLSTRLVVDPRARNTMRRELCLWAVALGKRDEHLRIRPVGLL